MELRNCPECGRVFTFIKVNLCPACREIDDKEFKKVKEYLEENPKIGVQELAEDTEVDESKIVRWIREGRIEGKNYTGMHVPCERCGRPVFQGRFCSQCSRELSQGFSKSTKENNPDINAKFHTKDL